MLQLHTLLFPTDGSACAEFAHAHAAFLARQYEADLHVLHVTEAPSDGPDALSALIEIDERDILQQLRAPVPPEVEPPAEERIRRVTRTNASAASGVLTYAAEVDADLIVMGTHGRRGMGRLLMGSVAEEVVRLSACPTLTVCGSKAPVPDRDINQIVVPMGLSAHTPKLFAHALAIAATYDAQLALVHVIESSGLPSVYQLDAPATDDEAVARRVEAALAEYAEAARAEGVSATTTVRRGHPTAVILDLLDDRAADLVTIATHGRTGIERLLIGSVAEKVVRMAPCPVFTVKSFGKSLLAAEAPPMRRAVAAAERA